MHGRGMQSRQNKGRAMTRAPRCFNAIALEHTFEEKSVCVKISKRSPLFFTNLFQEKLC